MEQATLQLADLPGSATSSNNEPTNGAAPVVNQGGGGDDDDSDKGGDEDVPMTFPQRVNTYCDVCTNTHHDFISPTTKSRTR